MIRVMLTEYLLRETTGISPDVIYLTHLILTKLENSDNVTISGVEVNDDLNLLQIDKLVVNYIEDFDSKSNGFLDLKTITKNEIGISGEITIHMKDYTTLSHELNHLFRSNYIDIFTKEITDYIKMDTALDIKNNQEIDTFIFLMYLLTKEEKTSNLYNSLFFLSENLPTDFTNEDFNNLIKNDPIYKMTQIGKNYTYDKLLSNTGHDKLKQSYSRFMMYDRLDITPENLEFIKNNIHTTIRPTQPNTSNYEVFFKRKIKWINEKSIDLNKKIIKLYTIIPEIQEKYGLGKLNIKTIVNKINKKIPFTDKEQEFINKITNK